jgi:peptidyl-prolyl cis-trans isomerase A (cyclophilin A)
MMKRRTLVATPILLGAQEDARYGRVLVRFETELGNIEVALSGDRAPVTVRNFLRYVDAGLYDGGVFHRTVKTKMGTREDNQPQSPVKIDVVQGGQNPEKKQSFGAIELERTAKTGLRHVDGAISMARSGPDTATSDFFFCIGAQPELDFGGKRNPDGQGFAVFGLVLKGREVLDKIQVSRAEGQKLTPPVRIRRVSRIE